MNIPNGLSTPAAAALDSKGYEVLDQAARIAHDYLAHADARHVAADTSDQGIRLLHEILGGSLPEDGEEPEAVIDRLAKCAARGVVASGGPRFFGYVVGGSHPVSIAADWLVSAWDQFAATFDAGPMAAIAEQTALDWVIDLLGLEHRRPISGGFTTGTTAAHLTALAAARHALLAARGWDVEADGLWGAPSFAVLVSRDVHVSLLAALQYLGVGRARVHWIDTDEHGRMRPDSVAETLSGIDAPALVCAQAGEINTGAFDPIAEVAEMTSARGDWLHIDGAFGLWAAAAPELSHLTEGIGLADSWATDAHKMLNVPYDCGIVLSARPDAHRSAMSTQAPYTTMGPNTPATQQRNGMDFVPEMARRARGVPVYATIRALGRTGVAELVSRCHKLALQMATQLELSPDIRIVNQVVFNQILVDCSPARMSTADCEQLVGSVISAIRRQGTCWVGGTRWRGRPMLRLSIANWSTTQDDIDHSAVAILDAIRQCRERQATSRHRPDARSTSPSFGVTDPAREHPQEACDRPGLSRLPE